MIAQNEELEVWTEFSKTRSAETREQLILQSVPLVHYILGRMNIHRGADCEYEDLVHQGLLGLIDAVNHFDLKHGTRFSTYASVRIRGKILDYLRSCDWMSRSARQRVRAIQTVVSDYWRDANREPTDEEIAARLGIDVTEVRQGLLDSSRVLISLDTRTVTSEENYTLYDSLPDNRQPDPEEVVTEQDLQSRMVAALKKLSEREQLVLSLYYYEELTLREIGEILNISESRVCQIHARAVLTVKALMMKHE